MMNAAALSCKKPGILAEVSGFVFTDISRRRHSCAFFENLAEIIRVIAATYQLRHMLDFFFVIAFQDFFSLLHPQVHQITGKFLMGFFHKTAAYIVHIHVQMVFCDPFQCQIGI